MMLELNHVSFQYEESDYGVFNIDLRIAAGECVVLIGESGCGKTTVTRLVNALAPAYYPGIRTGGIFIGHKELSELHTWEVGKIVGSVFQDPRRQFFSSELLGEVAFACENHGLSQHEIRRNTDMAIRRMNLGHLTDRPLDVLSGGEKQRVAIASAYAMQPSIYVLDEPTSNLDAAGINHLKQTLHQLKEEGYSLLIAEHRLTWLDGLADRYVYMAQGHIRGVYSPAEMKALPDGQREKMGLRAAGQIHICSFADSRKQAVPAIQAEHISCRRGKTVIWEGLSLSAPCGQITAVTGHNGVGKTTMGLTLSGLMPFQGGCVYIGGTKLSGRKLRQHVYYCSNDTGTQFFTNSVLEELLLDKKRTERNLSLACDILARMKLLFWKDTHPAKLSGGQRQRLAVACALLSEKNILILDEPTSGLDGRNMRLIAAELKAAAQMGKTILVITHDEELINTCCHGRICIADAK